MRLEIPGGGDLFKGGPQPPWCGLKLQSAISTTKHKNLNYIFLQISGY